MDANYEEVRPIAEFQFFKTSIALGMVQSNDLNRIAGLRDTKKPPVGGFCAVYLVGDTWIEHVTPAV